MNRRDTGWIALAVVFMFAASARASDWPQFRGPNRDGVSKETGLLKSWPAGGPKLLWKTTALGEGYSAPSVVGDRIFGMGLRGSDEVVWALDVRTGKEAWSTKIGAGASLRGTQGGDGPRATPTVDGDRLYTMGASGELVCLAVSNGKLRWHKNLVEDFGGSVPQWGYSESPLVDGEKVIVTPGNPRAMIVALDKMTGDVIWKSPISQTGVAYSSCLAADIDGQRQYIQFTSRGIVGVSAKDGTFLWSYPKPRSNGINCSMPIYRDHMVFASASYGGGSSAARLSLEGPTFNASEVYSSQSLSNHHGGIVLIGDHIYGCDNRELVCMNFKTGEVAWTNPCVGKGSVTFADGNLYVRHERYGPVALVEANPAQYVEKGRFQPPDRAGQWSWCYPVIANGRMYLRDADIMLCYDVKGSSSASR